MRLAPAVVVITLLCFTRAGAAGLPSDGGDAAPVASALQALSTAQKNLEEAVQRIEKDPPSNNDLEAAHAAVEALKAAIDAGASHEEADLDYARAALAARKVLRSRRELVEDRRAKVHIFDERRKLDSALASLNEAARKTEPKEVVAKDFADAHAAADSLEKELKEAQPLGRQDAKFASYLSETGAALTRVRKAIDDRWTELELGKHEVLVQQAREALTAAVAPFGKDSTDAQLETAARASADLGKLLEAGKPFEPRDQAYRANAEKARGELAQAKKRMDVYVASVGLAKLTADIEPARQSLLEASKALRVKNPTPEQLAEAKTATFVVSKLLDQSQAKADASPAFAQYLSGARALLTDVEVQLQLRSLEAAKRDLMQALKGIERRAATDEDFQEANTALRILEKTLETVHGTEPLLKEPVADAKWQVHEAKSTLERRRYQVDLLHAHDTLAEALKSAEAECKKIWEGHPTDEVLQMAENAVKALTPILEANKPFIKKDADYKEFDQKTEDRARELGERIASRRIQLAALAAGAKLKELVTTASDAIDVAQQPESGDVELRSAARFVEVLTQTLEANRKLEKAYRDYGTQAERTREQLGKFQEALGFATDSRALRKQLAEALPVGDAAVDQAGKVSDPNTQKELYEKALRLFGACTNDGATRVAEKPALAKVVMLVDKSPHTPKEVMALCSQRTQATQLLLDQVAVVVYFHNGPKKDFETAKAKLGHGDKPGALAQFGQCIADGRIFAQRYPTRKDEPYEVAGAKMTVSQLVEECVKERSALAGK